MGAENELLKSGQAETSSGGGSGGVAPVVKGGSKQKVLAELEEKWNRADKRGEFYELSYQQSVKTLTAVRAGLQSIYNRLGCGGDAGLMGNQGVTESNMLQYCGVIEQRTNEILLLYSALQDGEEEEPVKMGS